MSRWTDSCCGIEIGKITGAKMANYLVLLCKMTLLRFLSWPMPRPIPYFRLLPTITQHVPVQTDRRWTWPSDRESAGLEASAGARAPSRPTKGRAAGEIGSSSIVQLHRGIHFLHYSDTHTLDLIFNIRISIGRHISLLFGQSLAFCSTNLMIILKLNWIYFKNAKILYFFK